MHVSKKYFYREKAGMSSPFLKKNGVNRRCLVKPEMSGKDSRRIVQ